MMDKVVAIQLAGGKGTRLQDVTKGLVPKPLVRFEDKTLLETQVVQLARYGISDFVWVCYHMTEQFDIERQRLLEKYSVFIDSIQIYKEDVPLSTFGSLKKAAGLCKAGVYLVTYGDIVFSLDIYRYLEDFRSFPGSDSHILTKFSDHPEDSDKIELSSSRYIKNFISKKSPYQQGDPSTTTSGIYLARESFFKKLEHWSGQCCDLYSEVLPLDHSLVTCTAYVSGEFYVDVGTVERYQRVLALLKSGDIDKMSYYHPRAAILLDRDGVLISEDGHLLSKDQLEFNDKIINLCSHLRSKGILVGVVTNQPHIAQGRISMYNHNILTNIVIRRLAADTALDFYYQCMHYPPGSERFLDEVDYFKVDCNCRKPRTGLIQQAIHEHNLDPSRVLFVGDSPSDRMAGDLAGIKCIHYRFDGDFDTINTLIGQVNDFFAV